MKKLFSFFLVLPLSVALAASPAQLIRDGQREMQQGNWEAAKVKFEEVLLSDPKNVTARNLLKIVQGKLKENPRAYQIAATRQVIIPLVNFENAGLAGALDALRKKAAEVSNGAVNPNFVLDPAIDKNTPLTLTLRDVPLEVVLKYIARLAQLSVNYEPYAITLTPEGKESASAAPATE